MPQGVRTWRASTRSPSSDPTAPSPGDCRTTRPAPTARNGRGRRAGDREQNASHGRGRYGVGKSFAYLVPAISAAAEQEKRSSSRRTRSAFKSNCCQGFAVPAGRDAAGVLGRAGQGALELHQPPEAGRRRGARGATFQRDGSSNNSLKFASGAGGPKTGRGRTSTSSRCRTSGTPSEARTGTAWGRSARGTVRLNHYKVRGGSRHQ